MLGRRFSEGLHQAIEAKENVRIQNESQTWATITLQNYFRMYDKLAGMTGTAWTEREEFHTIYGLDVVVVPTHRPMVRARTRPTRYIRAKKRSIRRSSKRFEEMHRLGRPVLVGTVSIEKSEYLERRAQAEGRDPPGPERQVPRERSRDCRAGGSFGRGDHRDQHGRPRRRHLARRQSHRAWSPNCCGSSDLDPTTAEPEQLEAAQREAERICAEDKANGPARWVACTSWARSVTKRGASTTSSAAAPDARAIRAPRASSSRSRRRADAALRRDEHRVAHG